MKTAVSIPDDVFQKAERLARRMKKSRSELFSNALAEYVARHAPDHVTEGMNQVCAEIGLDETDPFVSAASRRTLARRMVISQGESFGPNAHRLQAWIKCFTGPVGKIAGTAA
jgi:metal-responsive CopG/Arc/MetJ family transcriptional regulator